jgi:hypothetical protein
MVLGSTDTWMRIQWFRLTLMMQNMFSTIVQSYLHVTWSSFVNSNRASNSSSVPRKVPNIVQVSSLVAKTFFLPSQIVLKNTFNISTVMSPTLSSVKTSCLVSRVCCLNTSISESDSCTWGHEYKLHIMCVTVGGMHPPKQDEWHNIPLGNVHRGTRRDFPATWTAFVRSWLLHWTRHTGLQFLVSNEPTVRNGLSRAYNWTGTCNHPLKVMQNSPVSGYQDRLWIWIGPVWKARSIDFFYCVICYMDRLPWFDVHPEKNALVQTNL